MAFKTYGASDAPDLVSESSVLASKLDATVSDGVTVLSQQSVLRDVREPTEKNDAANKSYVDSNFVSTGSGALRASVGVNENGPFLTIYTGIDVGDVQRYTFYLKHPSYNAPAVVYTNAGDEPSTIWHG